MTIEDVKVSVIMPAKNAATTLAECIDSILLQRVEHIMSKGVCVATWIDIDPKKTCVDFRDPTAVSRFNLHWIRQNIKLSVDGGSANI